MGSQQRLERERNEEFFMEKKSLEEFQNKIFMLPK